MPPRITLSTLGRRDMLRAFLQRESPASLSASPGQLPGAFASSSNPFAPTKAPGARSWTAPKYSIRRQKKLRQIAALSGWPAEVLPPAFGHATKMLGSTTAEGLDVPESSKSGSISRGASTLQSHPQIPSSKILDQVQLSKKGPYSGRKGAAFKGKAWERNFGKRQTTLKAAVEQADAKMAQWKQSKLDDKAKAKAALPF
ncbi:hypothetical protein OIO90_006493 [Microbotryomycetes sp. JL221]|nr:hypothetical protein OIO90_006493 [Microbotryomycetes sp. JL221]